MSCRVHLPIDVLQAPWSARVVRHEPASRKHSGGGDRDDCDRFERQLGGIVPAVSVAPQIDHPISAATAVIPVTANRCGWTALAALDTLVLPSSVTNRRTAL